MYYLFYFLFTTFIFSKIFASGNSNGGGGGANAALEKNEIEDLTKSLEKQTSPWVKPRFGSPILHISLIIPKAPDLKTGPELMFTLELSKRPSATIFISNKWLFNEKRYTCYTEYQFHGEYVRKYALPKHLIENYFGHFIIIISQYLNLTREVFTEATKNIKIDKLNNFTEKTCKNIGENLIKKLTKELLIEKKFKPNNDKEICSSSSNLLPLNCNINFENLKLRIEYKQPIKPILMNIANKKLNVSFIIRI
ncbi:hypothetical protein Mgra_00000600 [Meloidogyne graminicola]|uniref:Galectin n=1 Tax=Meloidogyne graminicola TaxID=189291 RepID=A0A8T0A4C5_9BILA|nr:hypothetical protein Mgra_00000600 [Meloidogyne graminicola]